MIIDVDIQDPAQRKQIIEQLLRLYEQAEISTGRAITLIERLYVTGMAVQKWSWPDVYVTSIFDEKQK